MPITQNTSQYAAQPTLQPQQQQQQRLQQQPHYTQASQQQYRPPGLPTPNAPQQQQLLQQQRQYQRPPQPQSQVQSCLLCRLHCSVSHTCRNLCADVNLSFLFTHGSL